MAEQDRRPTKAERREQKRQRRLEEERLAEEQAARDRRRNITYGVSLFVVVGVLIALAVGNLGQTIDSAITLTRAEAEDARAASGCEVLDVELVSDADVAALGLNGRSHVEPATAPAADVLYTRGRPTASGPHYTTPLPVRNGVPDNPLDERGSTHNMEHGAIIVWIDTDVVPGDDVDDIDDWVALLNDNGFAENSGRAGIMASPVTDAGIDSGKPLAIRGWGVAMDCDTWDRDWANAFVIEHYGPRGDAPERFQEYPSDALDFSGDDAATDEASDDAGDEASDDATEPTEGASEDAGDDASPAATTPDASESEG